MKTVTHRDDKSPMSVRVNVTDKLHQFQADFPKWVSVSNGEHYWDIPVTYHDLEATDVTTLAKAYRDYSGVSISDEDFASACSAGLRLAAGNRAKLPYRKSGGKASQAQIISWFGRATPEQMAAFKALATTDEQAAYVKEQMAE